MSIVASSPATPRAGFPLRRLTALLSLGLGLCCGVVSPAQAQLVRVLNDLYSTGTAPFDPARGAGFHVPAVSASKFEHLVRTNDTYQYRIRFDFNGADQDVHVRLTLARLEAGKPGAGTIGAVWHEIPAACQQPGSSISADGQTIDCRYGDYTGGKARTEVIFTVRALGTAPNGGYIPKPSFSGSSRLTPRPRQSGSPRSVRISAAPFYDVSIDEAGDSTMPSHGYRPDNGPDGTPGVYHRVRIGLRARQVNGAGIRGVEQLDPRQPLTLELDTSGYPPSTVVPNWPLPAHLQSSGGFIRGCGSMGSGHPSALFGGPLPTRDQVLDTGPQSSTQRHTVANGGECEVVQHDTVNHRLILRLRGLDTRQQHQPTQAADGSSLPDDSVWVAHKTLLLWSSAGDYPASGQAVSHALRLVGVNGISITGQPISGDLVSNNAASHDFGIRNTAQARLRHVPDTDASAPVQAPADAAIPAQPTVNRMVPGQQTALQLHYHNQASIPHDNVRLCQIIDRTAFDPAPGLRTQVQIQDGAGGHTPRVRYGAPPPAAGLYFSSTDSAHNATDGNLPAGTDGHSAHGQDRCPADQVRWFDTPQAAEAAGGLRYVQAEVDTLPSQGHITMTVHGLMLRKTWAHDIEVLSPVPQMRAGNTPVTPGSIIRNRAVVRTTNLPDHHFSGLHDHLEVVPPTVASRLNKSMHTPAGAAPGTAAAGQIVRWTLTPRFATESVLHPGTLTITDILPSGLALTGPATWNEQPLEATDVQPDTPATGMTTVRWTLPNVSPFAGPVDQAPALPPLHYHTRVLTHTTENQVLRNLAHISAGAGDDSPDCQYDAASQSLAACAKGAEAHLRVQTPPGWVIDPAGVQGRMLVDQNQNGQQDPDDWPLPGLCVQLSGTTTRGHPVHYATLTNAEGVFDFSHQGKSRLYAGRHCEGQVLTDFPGINAGTYQLHAPALPKGMTPGRSMAGRGGGTVTAQRIDDIRLTPRAWADNYVFSAIAHPARLSLNAILHNTHGGQASASDIRLGARHVQDAHAPLHGPADSPALRHAALPPGRYRLAGNLLPGYRQEPWQCVLNGQTHALPANAPTLDLGYGDTALCTLGYQDLPGQLTLDTAVINSHGRHARPEDFVLHADGPVHLSGTRGSPAITAVSVPAGTYTLQSDTLPNYVSGAWQCEGGTLVDDRVTVANGQQVHCSLSHTDQPVSLTLVVDMRNDHGGTATLADVPVTAQGPASISGISGTRAVTVAPVSPGVYELATPALPGYRIGKWVCSGGTLVGNRLTLGDAMNITCRIELKDIPATLNVSKTVDGALTPVAGTDDEHLLSYRIRVQHGSGADGRYTLTELPGFDPDVQVLAVQASRNGRALARPPSPAGHGGWRLAEGQALAIGAEDLYQVQFRIRVPYGSPVANNRCTPGGSTGHGLFNQVRLDNLASDAEGSAPQLAQACLDTPVPTLRARLSIDKRSPRRSIEVGDTLDYQLRIRNSGSGAAITPVVVDHLPAGFRLEPGSIRIQGAHQTALSQQGRLLRITLDQVGAPRHTSRNDARPDNEVVIRYRLRATVGSQEGDGINRAHVECLMPDGRSTTRCSNEARWKVKVLPGIFSEEACLTGQIFVDCNGNSVKDAEELGIPGVRLYFQNGTWLQSDAHGKYSHCGLRPRTHVLKVDSRTLPRRSRLVTSSAQNSGDAHSLFIDARKGMLHRADFIEGSCSASVLQQVRTRQVQVGAASAQANAGITPMPSPAQQPIYFRSRTTRQGR
ncbi:MAG: hypothetical protein Q4E06_05300 [Lautropia sp.]|nr:hypothetical protein [Lautropia sp.]